MKAFSKNPANLLIMSIMILTMAFTTSCSKDDDSGDPINGGGGNKGNDIANYKTKKIGTQTWMTENLDYEVEGGTSKCYDNDPVNCAKYGRLYDWATAMALPASCNLPPSCASQISENHRGICPSGWHIPSRMEWDELITLTSGKENYGASLKAKNSWNDGGNGTDNYDFAALPGGRYIGGSYRGIGNGGAWWSSSEFGSASAYVWSIYYYDDEKDASLSDDEKDRMFSVRCIQD
jgi:uncharacterized protein (TIGR02145 family)